MQLSSQIPKVHMYNDPQPALIPISHPNSTQILAKELIGRLQVHAPCVVICTHRFKSKTILFLLPDSKHEYSLIEFSRN